MVKYQFDKEKVKQWLEGQKEAEKIIERERVNFLLSLTPQRSLEIYLSLASSGYKSRREPSFLLLQMRHSLHRLAEKTSFQNSKEEYHLSSFLIKNSLTPIFEFL
jgi:hypothetical protein